MLSDSAAAPLLTATDLACRRGQEWLFRGLGFSIAPGQLIWLRGHNGSGKTSLLRIVVGLSAPHQGRLERRGAAEGHQRTVYLGHTNGLKDQLTVFESLQFLARLHDCANDEASVLAALQRLSIRHRRHVPTRWLSQGQRRRVALARLALEREASLWVLDEPFDALDQEGIAVVHDLIAGHLERGGAVLLTSHLALHADRVQADVLDLDSAGQK